MTARVESRSSSRWSLIAGVIALGVCTALALAFSGTAVAKKKAKTPRFFQSVVQANAPIPDDVASGHSTPVDSVITVPKKFKGRVVADVNVTGITTTGSGPGAARDLTMRIIAPSGRSVRLWNGGFGDQSIGPLTFDDDSPVSLCPSPPCSWATDTLDPPFAGTSNLQFLGSAGTGPLSQLNGVAMRGAWTFEIWDDQGSGDTSTLNSWGLQVTAAKPVK
jgi:hypothetical protein